MRYYFPEKLFSNSSLYLLPKEDESSCHKIVSLDVPYLTLQGEAMTPIRASQCKVAKILLCPKP